MTYVVKMPKLSDTMEEGGVATWLKKEGDFVGEGEPLLEIETDKATMEYASPEEGILLKIAVQPGQTVALNAPIAILGAKGETYDAALLVNSGSSNKAAAEKKEATSFETKSVSQAATLNGKSAVVQKSEQPVVSSASNATRLKASPLAKKMAKAKGLELAQVIGSGPAGRIISRDVENALPNITGFSLAQTHASTADQVIPLSMMRKTIAKRLLQGKNEAPHFYLTRSCQMDKLLTLRESINQNNKDPDFVKISVNDLLVACVAKALRKHQGVNASWQGESIMQWGSVHVAIAVALPQGLVTPVIRGADQLNFRSVATISQGLIQKAKKGELTNQDYQGGTFTISNLGMFGIEEFTAIINPPQAAILAVGATRKVPVVKEDGAFGVEQQMKLTLSCDHRVIDGAMGAMFLQTLISYIEDPVLMLV
ncbi:MAG: pyruvate dehydrogenase complex dihydrolipoamide acetyltransferase [Oligoflexales bacterium]|nr:pyruvate dehydrogenase complex dihydrolipoamide acetyltransferase [Oligoflexales bacterium]